MKITNNWFYQDTPIWVKIFLLTFIWGDALVLFPLLSLIAIITVFNLYTGLIIYMSLICFRYFIEIFYWLLQQFGPKTYRPVDFGLKNLENNAIYIIYQLISFGIVSIFLFLIFLTLKIFAS